MADNYWFNVDESVVAYNDHEISLVFKDEDGDAVDISAWTDMTYKATRGSVSIDVADAAITVTSSDTVTDDTIIIPLYTSSTGVAPGRYNHEFACTVSGSFRTIFRGTLTVEPRIVEEP